MLSFYSQPIEFVKNLKYMGISILGVFIIIGVIMSATYLTGYLTNKLARSHDDD